MYVARYTEQQEYIGISPASLQNAVSRIYRGYAQDLPYDYISTFASSTSIAARCSDDSLFTSVFNVVAAVLESDPILSFNATHTSLAPFSASSRAFPSSETSNGAAVV